jgi:DNA-binding Lrp family transcriptional regulator
MSKHILAAISSLPQLHGSVRHTAQRLAYYADNTGRVQKAHTYLANDMHISERTVYRHVARLQALGVIAIQGLRLSATRCAINVYTFLLGIPPLHKRAPDTMTSNQAEREKTSSRARKNPRQEADRWWYELYTATHGLGWGATGPPLDTPV